MTKGMGLITNVFAMGKGTTEGTSSQIKINRTADSVANYTGNFLESAIYKTPLNPLLSRGIAGEDFADFIMVSNATAITSYEIHKADNATLTNAKTGINQSNSSTQTYSAVNRIYPDSTTVNDYLSNLETTRGNVLKIYDYESGAGQRFITYRTLINEVDDIDTSEIIITVDGASSLAVNDIIVVDNEEMLITGISSNDLTVVRGYNDTAIVAHADDSKVFEKDLIDHLWVLIYSDDPNTHHFAKITEVLENDIWGDGIEFSPSIGVDIPKDTKFAIFSSLDSNLPRLDSNNQTLVACAYGLQSEITVFSDATCDYNDDPTITHNANSNIVVGLQVSGAGIPDGAYVLSITNSTTFELSVDTTGGSVTNGTLRFSTRVNNRHYLNTHVSRPFFYFVNDKDKLEPATRYVLRSSSWNGSSHTYTYSTFLTEQEYSADIIDYGPYTMEATLVDMLYKADNPAAMNFLEYTSDDLFLTNGSPDTIALSVTDTTCDLTNNDATVTCDASTFIRVGMNVTSAVSGFPSSATVLSINTGGEGTNVTSFELSANFTGSTASNQSLTFTSVTASFDNSITDLDGTEGTNWSLQGILRDSRFTLDGAEADIYCVDSSTDSTATTLTMAAADFSGASTSNDLRIRFLAHAVDLDHNKMYCAFDSSNHLKHSFRMAHRPNDDGSSYYGHNIGHTRFLHYTDSPLTNTIIPNAMEMVDYESVTSTGGYVDIVFADTQKILAKKIKEGDPLYVHQIVTTREVGANRIESLGTMRYPKHVSPITSTDIEIFDLENDADLRYLLSSPIPKSQTITSSRYDPLYDSFTVNISGTLYHFVPDAIENESSDTQILSIIRWRKATDTEYKLTTTTDLTDVPSFNTKAFRRKYSFLADNIIDSEIPIDTNVYNYNLAINGTQTDANWNRNVTNFDSVIKTKNPSDNTAATVNIGEISLEKGSQSRINDIHLVLRGGQMTGHRIKIEYGDKDNKFLKLQTHLKDDRFLESYNKTDYLPYADNLSNVSLYSYPINSDLDADSSLYRYNIRQSPSAIAYTHVRGVLSYLDYFRGQFDVEKRVFSGTVESVEQVVEDGMFKLKIRGRNNVSKLLGPIVNKDFKFTEDIVYSTIGPFERMAFYGSIEHGSTAGIYEVGSTVIIINQGTARYDAAIGDLLFTTLGIFLGRIYAISGSDPYTITLEEGIPTRLKDTECIMISSQFSGALSDITVESISDESVPSEFGVQYVRGNTVSFAKSISANPYNTTRVNSLSGAGNKGVIFTSGNSLSLSTKNAPVLEGNTLVSTSSSNHPLAKGYSIHAPDKIEYDLPFYCHLADEITDKYTVDYTNLHTVSSLTEYEVINMTANEEETIFEMAPICPAVLARTDNNPLDGRDKTLVSMGNFPDTQPKNYQGIFNYTSGWIEELNEGDFLFDSSGNLFGRIIDISSSGNTSNGTCFTLDRPLFKAVTSSETIYKYYTAASPPQYYAAQEFRFSTSNSDNSFGGGDYIVSILESDASGGRTFLDKLEAGMKIKIEGHTDKDNSGVFSIGHIFKDETNKEIILFPRKQSTGNENIAGYDAFNTDASSGEDIRITVLTDYYTQGLYFLNTQGLSQGGVLTLTNPILSSPNAVDGICKPIKWAGGIYHYITDNSVATKASTVYNPNASAHTIFSDFIDRYGNTKWRYFGLQKGGSLSYINRRRKDGQIKDAYTSEKGRVNGYATAYRISDAKYGNNKLMKFPYGYHNNDWSWAVRMYDDNDDDYVELFETTNDVKSHPYFLEYLSPESRDFRPIMGSNFADFDKHGTTVTSPDHAQHEVLSFPRYMPRLHDNHRGGDWQENMEVITDSLDASTVYQKFTADGATTSNANDYAIDVDTGTTPDEWFINPTADDDTHFSSSLAGQWVKLGGWTNRNYNRVFKLKSTFEDVSSGNGRLLIENDELPFTTFGADNTNAQTSVDLAITLAKGSVTSDATCDLTNSDATVTCDANANIRIGDYVKYGSSGIAAGVKVASINSGTEGTNITSFELSATFTGSTAANQTLTFSDSYDGNHYEQITVLYPPWIGPKFDGITRAKDHWELPDPKALRWFIFSPADIYPDSMSRKHHIGYSETVDSTAISRVFTDYNIMLKDESSFGNSGIAHEYYEGSLLEENEVDDQYEVLPISDASITPSQMKRFGLMRLIDCTYDWHFNLIDPERLPRDMTKLNTPNFEYTRFQPLKRLNVIITSYDSNELTVNNNAGSLLEVGDQIFTDKGFYLGKVLSHTSSTTFTLIANARKPILKTDGTRSNYYGYVHVCGDGLVGLASQDRHDSFYQFMTKGKGGKHTFTEANKINSTNMLQSMWSAQWLYYHSGSVEYYQIPYGVIDDASGATGTAIADGSYGESTIGAANADNDAGFTENKFLTHFNQNYGIFSADGTYPVNFNPLITLPPAFRTYYSDHTDTSNPEHTVNALQVKGQLVNKADTDTSNPIATEYSHASNVLEWIQAGGNPYWRCALVALGTYNVENSTGLRIPIGGKTRAAASAHNTVNNFAYSKPARTSAATNADLAEIKYGDGWGGFGGSTAYGNANSGEYSLLTLKGYETYWGIANTRVDGDTEIPHADANNYIACGVYSAFIPNLYLGSIKNTVIGDGTVGEANEGVITFTSINGNINQGWLRIEMDPTTTDNYNPFLNFVDLTGMYLVGNIGYEVDSKTNSLNYAPFNGGTYDVPLRTTTVESKSKQINYEVGFESMSNAVIDPKHIMYVHEHRRNITGKVVAHELLIDNIPYENAGNIEFFDNYRIMRPAETCLWPNSPEEININTLSAQTTKMPQNNNMYNYVPSLQRVNVKEEFMGPAVNNTNAFEQGVAGENEAVMSMYVAIDMDARHSQYKDLTGTVSINVGESVVTGSGTVFTTELQEGDVIKLDHQYCYVKTITSNTSLVIENKFANDANLSGSSLAYLINNTFTVLRDYIHLFNPTGNRNTFKDGSSYSMLLTDGVSKQKMSMNVQAKYWDDIAKCSITLSDKIKQAMYGIVSFGEIFTLTSSVPSKLSNPTTARIGSTVIIGEEVEDVINNLLSNEDIKYDISNNREYPYYIAPNYQGVDIFNAANFAAKYKEKELRVDETGISLIKQSNDLDFRPITLSYNNSDLRIISVTRNKSTFDLYNEIIVYGNGLKSIKRNRKSIDKFGKKTLEEVNMELISQDDVDSRAKTLLSAHSKGDDRYTVKMSKKGIEFVKAGDIITLDFPAEGIIKGQYKIYEIRRELMGLIELEVGTYRKDLSNRFAELSIGSKSNAASIRGSQFKSTTAPLDFFDSVKLKELRLLIKRIGLVDEDAFVLGFQTLDARKLDFDVTMGPQETVTEIIREEDFI